MKHVLKTLQEYITSIHTKERDAWWLGKQK